MQTASFSGFIKIVFYILTFYYVFKLLAKLFLPIIVKKVVEKAGENFQQQQQRSQGSSRNKTQTNDEVVFNAKNDRNPRETKKVGEYVDYEELD